MDPQTAATRRAAGHRTARGYKDEAISLYFEDSPEDDWTIEPISVMDAPAPKGYGDDTDEETE